MSIEQFETINPDTFKQALSCLRSGMDCQPGDRVTVQGAAIDRVKYPCLAGVVVGVTEKRVRVRVGYLPAYIKSPVHYKEILCNPQDVVYRLTPSSMMGEDLGVGFEFEGFHIGFRKAANAGAFKAMPEGVFYGSVNGNEITTPCSSAEHAMDSAFKLLSDKHH